MSKSSQLESILPALVCPVCRASLTLVAEELRCTGCRRAYPIQDGIPVLIPERGKES
jgi:uncharacterized protein YbaR (Trm112 family)